ncbi:DUF362 domain-containing protein [Candidatus Poribacteria bacterium]|nr:DUF362 domain-containing protein [Candidatus Poribacteria bacterium]
MIEKITRRKFIEQTAKIALTSGAVAASSQLLRADENYPPLTPPKRGKNSEIIVARRNTPSETVKAAIEAFGGLSSIMKPKDTVLLKPNISFPNPPQWATTTNPELISTMAKLCLEAGASRVIIADHPLRDPQKCLERTGIAEACKDIDGVHIKLLTEDRDYKSIEVNGEELKSAEVARLALKADLIINMPVAKSHSATTVSFSMKNMMGLVWDRVKFHQGNIHQAVAELNTVVKPELIILDATRILLTKGPDGPGEVEELNSVIIGTDPVAIDSYAVNLARWNNRKLEPENVDYIRIAAKLGLGEMDISKVSIREV